MILMDLTKIMTMLAIMTKMMPRQRRGATVMAVVVVLFLRKRSKNERIQGERRWSG